MSDTTYATIEELRSQFGSISSEKDSFIQRCLNAAAEALDMKCNWNVPLEAPAAASARMYAGGGLAYLVIDPCVSVTTVEVKDSPTDTAWTALTAGTYLPFRGDPRFPDFNRTPYNGIVLLGSGRTAFPSGKQDSSSGTGLAQTLLAYGLPTVRVTARFGYAATLPPNVKQAVLTQATRWVKRGEAAWADTVSKGDMGQLQYRKALDPDVAAMLVEARLVKPTI
jgi:hypothetical protein